MDSTQKPVKHHCLPSLKQAPIAAITLFILMLALISFVTAKSILAFQEIGKFNQPETQQITVEGEGKVTISPDMADITLGVESKAETVATAQTKNTEIVNQLIEKIKGLDITADDIKTTDYNVYENQVWNSDKQEYESKGWVVSQNVAIKVRDLTKVADIISVAGQNGVTNIYGLNFSTEDVDAFKQQARDEAIASAKSQAQAIADGLGVDLDGVVSYSEWISSNNPQPYYSRALDSGMGGAESAPTIEPGTEDFVITVSITYELSN